VYVKNALSTSDITLYHNGSLINSISQNSILYTGIDNKKGQNYNTPFCMLYWTGSDLLLH